MKFHLFFFILLFGATILTAKKSYPEYGSLDLRKECKMRRGHCKLQCSEKELRISFCIRPGTHCCM
ncbi:beta-defensin 41 isoform 2 precursor [Mus musculus]|uniref:Beta-defensin 41 n=2 Tax=Mus TaxID=862507 RepID=DFB41_MOUSE|eukprot:NP_001035116.1 beta-defensin 41 isoform 2 precursor [Mus musculus]